MDLGLHLPCLLDDHQPRAEVHAANPVLPHRGESKTRVADITETTLVDQLLNEAHHAQIMTGKVLSGIREKGFRPWQPRLSAIRPAIPVTRAPILDCVKAPGLQMIVEQRLECGCSRFSDMRGIVDDNVKSHGSRGGR